MQPPTDLLEAYTTIVPAIHEILSWPSCQPWSGWLQAEQEGNTPLKAAKKATKETAGAAAQRGDKDSSGSSAQQVLNCWPDAPNACSLTFLGCD